MVIRDDMRIGALEAGGTKMALAICTPAGELLEESTIATAAPEEVVPQMASWFAQRGIDALGVGAFGPTGVNPRLPSYGRILETPKLAWRGYDFLGALKKALDVPVGYDTDVNAACLGEVRFGAAQGLDCVVYLTVGTGIGAGVMIEGKMLHGMLHPEAGHILVARARGDDASSSCAYHEDCLEGLASGPAIEARWGAPAVSLAGRTEVWVLEAEYLAKGLATYILTYSPQRIILGGGVMGQLQLFPLVRAKTLEFLHGYLVTPELEDMQSYVVPAGCQGRQGILGALSLGLDALGFAES